MNFWEAENKKLTKAIKDVRARVLEIKYHHTKPYRGRRYDKTIRICGDIETRIRLALKGQGEGNRNLQIENKTLKGLLEVAICPNATIGCKDGVLINPYGEQESCQWCVMTKQTLKG